MSFFAKDWQKKPPFFVTNHETLPDTFLHFYNFGILAFMFTTFTANAAALFFATILNFVYECKDAVLRWDKIGRFGGDGFSIKDFIFAQAGILFFIYFVQNNVQLCICGILAIYLVGIIWRSIKPFKASKL